MCMGKSLLTRKVITTVLLVFASSSIFANNAELNQRADDAYSAYKGSFLVTNGSTQYFRTSIFNATNDYFWCQALDIQMVEDVYLRTKSAADKTLITNLLNTFLVKNAGVGGLYDWNWNNFNDDLLWAGLAFARGYQITGNATYLTQAKYVFNRIYDRGWDTALGGGIWWDVTKVNKSGLSNNTAVMLGCYIYEATSETAYLTKSTAVYTWILNTLCNKSTGAVYEDIKSNGTLSTSANVYNIGAFIGAANHLHRLTGTSSYFDDAKRSVDYVIANKTFNGGIMSNNQRAGTWQSEFSRGMGEFVRDNNLWSTYYNWMKLNADAAWNLRRTDRNIAWNNWIYQTPSDDCAAVECIGTVIQISTTPTTQPGFTAGSSYRLTPKTNPNSALKVVNNSTANGSLIEINSWITDSNTNNCEKFNVISLGYGYYRLTAANALLTSLDVAGQSSLDNTPIDIWGSNTTVSQYWKLVYDYDGYYKLKPKCAPSSCINITANNPANGTKCVLWKESYGDNERWQLTLAPVVVTGIEEESKETKLNIFPNPVVNYLTISSSNELKDMNYIIINTMGQQVMLGKSMNKQINVEILAPGIYNLLMMIKGKKNTVRFIKE